MADRVVENSGAGRREPVDIAPSAEEIFRPLEPAPWLSSAAVRAKAAAALEGMSVDAVGLIDELLGVLDEKEHELTAVREVLSAALSLSYEQQSEIARLRRRLADLFEIRRRERSAAV